MRTRTLPQEREIAARRVAVLGMAISHVGDGPEHDSSNVFSFQPERPVAAARNPFGRVEADEFAPGDAVELAPNLPTARQADVGRSPIREMRSVSPRPCSSSDLAVEVVREC